MSDERWRKDRWSDLPVWARGLLRELHERLNVVELAAKDALTEDLGRGVQYGINDAVEATAANLRAGLSREEP